MTKIYFANVCVDYKGGACVDAHTAGKAVHAATGDTLKSTYKVTNTGETPFTRSKVVVTDSDAEVHPTYVAGGSGDNGDDILTPGETWLYTAAKQLDAGDASLCAQYSVGSVEATADTAAPWRSRAAPTIRFTTTATCGADAAGAVRGRRQTSGGLPKANGVCGRRERANSSAPFPLHCRPSAAATQDSSVRRFASAVPVLCFGQRCRKRQKPTEEAATSSPRHKGTSNRAGWANPSRRRNGWQSVWAVADGRCRRKKPEKRRAGVGPARVFEGGGT